MAKQTKRPLRRLSEEQRPYVPKDVVAPGDGVQIAKLVRIGRSQAVRLPKEFRFEGDEVYVKREGSSVVLTPKHKPKDNPWKDFFAALDMFDPRFPIERHQPKEQQVRKSLDELFPPRRRRVKSQKK